MSNRATEPRLFLQKLLADGYSVIIWGHPMGSHTHSWIHYGFYRAFKHLGFNTIWLGNSILSAWRVRNITKAIVITEGQVDSFLKRALKKDHIVFGHHCKDADYWDRCLFVPMNVKVLNCDAYLDPKWWPDLTPDQRQKRKEACETQNSILWATDLLPEEINYHPRKSVYDVGFVGTVWSYNDKEIKEFEKKLAKRGLKFNVFTKVSQEKHLEVIQSSRFAPAIQGQWQIDHGYIPCRLFKNISYSHLGISNNPATLKVFEPDEIVCSASLDEMVDEMLRVERDGLMDQMIGKALQNVRDNHTYLNRIDDLMRFYLEAYEGGKRP